MEFCYSFFLKNMVIVWVIVVVIEKGGLLCWQCWYVVVESGFIDFGVSFVSNDFLQFGVDFVQQFVVVFCYCNIEILMFKFGIWYQFELFFWVLFDVVFYYFDVVYCGVDVVFKQFLEYQWGIVEVFDCGVVFIQYFRNYDIVGVGVYYFDFFVFQGCQ